MSRATSPETAAGRAALGGRRSFAFYFAILIALFLCSAAASAAYIQVQSRRDSRHDARADASFAAGKAARQLGRDVSLLKASVDRVAATPSIALAVAKPEACTLTFSGGGIEGHLDVLRPDGTAVCSSRPRGKDGELAGYVGESWVAAARAAPLFRAPVTDKATGRPVAIFASPTPAGKVLVAGFVDLRTLAPALASVYGGNRKSEFLVVRRDGDVIARSIDPRRWVGARVGGSAFARTGGATERPDLDGTRRIYASAPVPGTNWRLYVGEDEAQALAAGTRLRNREIAILLASLLVILLATAFTYRRIVLPMKRLAAGVKASAATGRETPVPVAGPAEVAELGSEVNALIASVNAQEIVRRAKEDAERANEAKSRFLSHMSHELRTPLAAIMGFSELLHRTAVDERQRTWSRHVLEGGRHLLELVNGLLEISRIEAGKLIVAIEPVDASRTIDDVLDLVSPLAADRGIGLQRGSDTVERVVLADPLRLKQVVLNLVSNAIKYNREAGTVTVSVEDSGRGTALIAVADTGEGIPPDQLELIFNPFERLGAERGPVAGSGLGLVVTKGLVEAMGGTIEAESTPGAGSTFRVELPLADVAAEERPVGVPEPDAAAEPATRGSVLYVDDDSANVDLVEGVFRDARPGLELTTTKSGVEGVQLSERRRPDLVLLDLNLPDIAGEELLRRLRARPETADVPVIVVSADSTSRHVTRLLGLGADAYVAKPLDVPHFLDVVDRLLPAR